MGFNALGNSTNSFLLGFDAYYQINDLFAVGQVIKNEPGQFSRAPTQDRMRELILFALSDQYFQLRKALGLAID